jgi:hypothetical protein
LCVKLRDGTSGLRIAGSPLSPAVLQIGRRHFLEGFSKKSIAGSSVLRGLRYRRERRNWRWRPLNAGRGLNERLRLQFLLLGLFLLAATCVLISHGRKLATAGPILPVSCGTSFGGLPNAGHACDPSQVTGRVSPKLPAWILESDTCPANAPRGIPRGLAPLVRCCARRPTAPLRSLASGTGRRCIPAS